MFCKDKDSHFAEFDFFWLQKNEVMYSLLSQFSNCKNENR